MGIIGVVAALTIPNLNGSTNDMEKIAKVKKVYANLTEAFDRATAVYGPIETWFVNDGVDEAKRTKRLTERLTEFLKLSRGIEYEDSCSSNIVLADGAHVKIYIQGVGSMGSKSYSLPSHKFYANVYVDIDGKQKGKNKYGYDVFTFNITSGGIIPEKDTSLTADAGRDTSFYDSGNFGDIVAYTGAAYWIIQNGNMDYLKVDADGKCPKSDKVLSWSNPSCK